MQSSADVVVIGAGVLGASVAFEVARSGRKVIVVDKLGAVAGGSTSASSAVVRFNYSTIDSVATAWESYHRWLEWGEYLGHDDGAPRARFRRTGMAVLDVPIAPPSMVTPHFDRLSIPYEHWDPQTLRERIPGIDARRFWPPKPFDSAEFYRDPPGDEIGALFTPDAGFIDDPQLAAQNLAGAAEGRGVEFRFHQEVIAINRKGNRVQGVLLAKGRSIDAPVVVNVGGPWSAGINRLAGVGGDFTVAVRPMRQEVHQISAPPGLDTNDIPAIADMDLGIYMRPAPNNQLLVGGTEPQCDPLDWVDDLDSVTYNATATMFNAQVTRLARRLPQVRVPNRPLGIAGVYDVASDWAPIYDRTDLNGYYVAMGTSGNQFKNAPLVGAFLAELIEKVEGGHDHDHEPVHYHCEHADYSINLGSFSRRRQLNSNTSGTVMG